MRYGHRSGLRLLSLPLTLHRELRGEIRREGEREGRREGGEVFMSCEMAGVVSMVERAET